MIVEDSYDDASPNGGASLEPVAQSFAGRSANRARSPRQLVVFFASLRTQSRLLTVRQARRRQRLLLGFASDGSSASQTARERKGITNSVFFSLHPRIRNHNTQRYGSA